MTYGDLFSVAYRILIATDHPVDEIKCIVMRQGSAVYYLYGDHLGSTSITATRTGGFSSELRYKAWGETRYSSGSTPTTFRYTGQREESSLGLYWYASRWYSASLGRFVSPDSIIPQPGNPIAWDRYSYVNNSPTMYIDPSGHFTEDAIMEYLLQYYEGNEDAARNTLKQWKKDEKWWEMITLAEGGDHLFGFKWWVESNYTNGSSENFMGDFLGSGQDSLIGLNGLDLVELQKGKIGDWNAVYEGFYRQQGNEAPAFWSKEPGWKVQYIKPGWAATSTKALDLAFVLVEVFFPASKVIRGVAAAGAVVSALNQKSYGALIVDALNWEQNDHVVIIGSHRLNFQKTEDGYRLEGN